MDARITFFPNSIQRSRLALNDDKTGISPGKQEKFGCLGACKQERNGLEG